MAYLCYQSRTEGLSLCLTGGAEPLNRSEVMRKMWEIHHSPHCPHVSEGKDCKPDLAHHSPLKTQYKLLQHVLPCGQTIAVQCEGDKYT